MLLSRRQLLAAAAALASTPGMGACAREADDGGELGAFRLSTTRRWDRGFKVHYFAPANAKPDAEILFVLHGRNRDPENYLRAWTGAARAAGMVLLAPEYDENRFEGAREYNLGGVQDERGEWRPRQAWTFHYIEQAFDEFLARSGRTAQAYSLYGHSAGAQFIQRYMLFMPAGRVSQAICANAGWYTFPTRRAEWPYGLDDAPVSEAQLRAYFAKPLVVLLGDQDQDVEADGLRRTEEANAQGPNRYARGRAFFETARREADRLGVPFAWELRIARGVAHDNVAMSRIAAQLIVRDSARQAA